MAWVINCFVRNEFKEYLARCSLGAVVQQMGTNDRPKQLYSHDCRLNLGG